MAKKKLGICQIEINKKFAGREEAFRYAKRLREYIRYECKTKADKGYLAQAMIVISNIKGNVSKLSYERSGKVGRPKKIRHYSSFDFKWYKGDLTTDWHIHILLVSKPKLYV